MENESAIFSPYSFADYLHVLNNNNNNNNLKQDWL